MPVLWKSCTMQRRWDYRLLSIRVIKWSISIQMQRPLFGLYEYSRFAGMLLTLSLLSGVESAGFPGQVRRRLNVFSTWFVSLSDTCPRIKNTAGCRWWRSNWYRTQRGTSWFPRGQRVSYLWSYNHSTNSRRIWKIGTPELASKMKITLVEALPSVLPMFSKQLIDYTESTFKEAKSIFWLRLWLRRSRRKA